MNIYFCNAFHNGDIHYSRTFISNIINDISEIYPDTNFHARPTAEHAVRTRFIVREENIYINTWVGCWKNPPIDSDTYTSVSPGGCTISANESLYRDIYEDISNHLGIKLKLS